MSTSRPALVGIGVSPCPDLVAASSRGDLCGRGLALRLRPRRRRAAAGAPCEGAGACLGRINRSARRGGFTLVELMVVCVLIGIFTALILPEMKGSYEEALLRATSRKLISLFQLANSRAITIHQPHRVRLDLKNGRYVVEPMVGGMWPGRGGIVPARDVPGGEGTLDTRIAIEIRPARIPPDDEEAEPQASFAAEDAGPNHEPADAITFYPDGTADNREILLQDRERFRLALRINPITARVRIVELGRE